MHVFHLQENQRPAAQDGSEKEKPGKRLAGYSQHSLNGTKTHLPTRDASGQNLGSKVSCPAGPSQ